ncbi:GNAT family N-acetyltransferase [Caenimonas sp. SL110]|uniref:GNAT family N-acetyltransferase n=1 Tax=Caenimonas sp. SL110 TaxID=1450524 RepID=UPI0009E4C26E
MIEPSRIELVAAQAGDADALVEVRIEAMRESLERVGRFDASRARERFLSGFVPEHTRHVVVDGERVGFVVVKPAGHALLLDHLYIRPAFQRRGIGAAVLETVFAEADAKNQPLRVGALTGSDSNRFYQRHGFELTERAQWDNYYLRVAGVKSTRRLPQRIIIIGMSGSGKTTLAHEIAARAGIPHIELDGLFWGPGWEPRAPASFRADVKQAVDAPCWVIDGNYSSVREIVWPHADMVVWLNLSFWTTFARVFARTLNRSIEGTLLWNGNRESFGRSFFSRESILWWVIRHYHDRRRSFAALRANNTFANLQWVELRRPEQVDEFIQRLSA